MYKDLYWIGIRQSDIDMIPNMFTGSVCLFGEQKLNSYVFSSERCNQNIITDKMDVFYCETLNNIIKEKPNCKFMFYNPNKAYKYGEEILSHSICCNDKFLLDNLNDKIWVRKIISQIVKTVPSLEITFNQSNIENTMVVFSNYKKFILQRPVSGGGTGTFLFDSENDTKTTGNLKSDERILISPYIEDSFSINTTLIIGAKNHIVFPSSIQIIEQIDNKFLYRGADYIAFNSLNENLQEKIIQNAEKIANYLRSVGYRGILGIDFLVDCENEVYFVELNNRFQASTDLINIVLNKQNTSVQELNIQAFNDELLPEIEMNIPLSDYYYYNESNCNFNDVKNKYEIFERQIKNSSSNNVYNLVSDGFDINAYFTDNCYGFKVIFKKQICMPSPNGDLWINENIRYINPNFYDDYKTNFLKLKTALLNQGVCVSKEISKDVKEAVYMSIDINFIFNEKKVMLNCPYNINFSQLSPFFIDDNSNLTFAGQILFKVEIDKSGIPFDAITSSGKHISQIVYMSEDRLRIKTMSGCDYKKNGIGCDFCNNSSKSVYFDIDDIIESINYAVALYGQRLKHFLIGGGTDFREIYWELVKKIVRYIHSNKNLPQEITLMVAPFDTSKLLELKKLDISDLSINIETYDDQLAHKLMRGKGIKRQFYFNFFEIAKKLWVSYGDLRSMIMIGLDKTDDLYKLVSTLANLGVQPVLSIFRPLPNTPMENYIMPPNDYLEKVFCYCTNICQNINPKYSLGPKCFACKNNVLAI